MDGRTKNPFVHSTRVRRNRLLRAGAIANFFVVKRRHLLFTLIIAFTVSLGGATASGHEEKAYDRVDRDSYTNKTYKNSNYGGFIYLYCGNGYAQFDTIMHFTLANRPVLYSSACLYFSTWDVASTINVSVWTVSNSWGEDTITYENRPMFYMLIMRSSVIQDGWCQVDVTDFVRRVTEISFCLTAPNATDFMYIFSREYALASYTPYIEYTYDVTISDPGFDPWVIIGTIATVSAVIGYKIWKMRGSKS